MSTLPMVRPADADSGNDDFDWREDDNIICRQQDAVAIYPNRYGQAVIRRERAWDEQSDVTIIIGPECAIGAAYGILRAAGHGDLQLYRTNGVGCEDVPDPARESLLDGSGPERKVDDTDRFKKPKVRTSSKGPADVPSDAPVTPGPGELFPIPEAAE